MLVVATAGHVDHGKSTLVRAITGMEPDRWAEERRRGMTIDLGFAWTDDVSFVDVPGHDRFLPNMLAGLAPAPAVLVVVAADEGWREQTEEHVRAVELLDIRHVLPVVTRCDVADPSSAVDETARRLGLAPVCVSAVTGAGLPELRDRLAALARDVGPPGDEDRPRLWVDRAFSIAGAGTVVTGTLSGGAVSVGDALMVDGRRTTVRGLQSCDAELTRAEPGTRVAMSLRGVRAADVRRGSVVVRPGQWRPTTCADVALVDPGRGRLPADLVLHVGSAAVTVRVRPLGTTHARVTWRDPMPLRLGDRGVFRHPGGRGLVAGAEVVDLDPPALQRRGAAQARAVELATTSYAERRGIVPAEDVSAVGAPAEPLVTCGRWVVHPSTWTRLTIAIADLVDTDDGITLGAAADRLGIPDAAIVARLAAGAGVPVVDGRLVGERDLDPGVAALRERLARHPFDADVPALPPAAAAIAHRHGLVLRLGDGVCLLPDALDVAARRLTPLAQPFSVGAARDALATSRRVAVPVLEALDAAGVTTKHADGRRSMAAAQTE